MRIAVGSDHAGFALKQDLAAYLRELGHQVLDVGTHSTAPVDYPDYAEAVGNAVLDGRAERAVLVCGSGVGASVAANKLTGIRAGLCHDTWWSLSRRRPEIESLLKSKVDSRKLKAQKPVESRQSKSRKARSCSTRQTVRLFNFQLFDFIC